MPGAIIGLPLWGESRNKIGAIGMSDNPKDFAVQASAYGSVKCRK